MSIKDYFHQDLEQIEPQLTPEETHVVPAVVISGDVSLEAWQALTDTLGERALFLSVKGKLQPVGSGISLELHQQLQEAQQEELMEMLQKAIAIHFVGAQQAGATYTKAQLMADIKDPENTVVVLPKGEEEEEDVQVQRDELEKELEADGVDVVYSLEDAAFLVSTYY